MDRTLIDRFEADADVPARAIEGLTREELLAFPVPGTWSIQQLIVHLMDSHVAVFCRMRKIIGEDNPLLTAYDENGFVKHCCYEQTDAKAAAEIFRLTQRMMANVLRHLPDEAFKRTGIHTERGKVTLGELVPDYIKHLEHHMTFLRAKRAALGKPLASR
jgi:hypothetical protein